MSGVPGPVGRFVQLFFGPLYLILLAAILVRATDCSMAMATIAVFTGAAVVVAIIVVLCGHFDSAKQSRRFSISSLMLVTAVLAIYLAYIGQFVRQIDASQIDFSGVAIFSFFVLFFIAITTLVLLRFADALLAFFETAARVFRPRRDA